MALKVYEWRGFKWQFDEADAPADAVPVEQKAGKPAADKAAKAPANKSRAPRTKKEA